MSGEGKSVLDRLLARRRWGIKPGLDVADALSHAQGHPERAYGCLHVAGTNGKGSVCAMLAAVLQAAGLRTGLYTSPHLVRFNERFRVNDSDISDEDLLALAEEVDQRADEVGVKVGRPATFFECATAMAFEYFRRAHVQVAVIETGLGGRLDATNVVTPLLSVITRISLEHMQYLGNNLAAIAAEKAGIIKPGRPVVCGRMADEAREVILATARARNARLVDAADTVTIERVSQSLSSQVLRMTSARRSYGRVTLPLPGDYQLENTATVVAALETLEDVLDVEWTDDTIRTGLKRVRWPGRCQLVRNHPPVMVDGAHNPGAAEVLAASLRRLFDRRPIGLVFGICGDKDVAGFLRPLAGLVQRAWAVAIRNERSLAPDEAARAAAGFGIRTEASDVGTAIAEAIRWAGENGGAVCVAGSLFLVGEVLEHGVGDGPVTDGRVIGPEVS